MIDVKAAVAAAKKYAADLLEADAFLLEELDSTDGHFTVTLSFIARDEHSLNECYLPVTSQQREYKSFHVRKSDGVVDRMTIRQLT